VRGWPLVVALLAACATPAGPADQARVVGAVRLGNAAYQRHDYAAFLEHARRAAELSPDNPDLTVRVARALVLTGHGREGLDLLGRVLELGVAYDLDRKDWDAVRAEPDFTRARARVAANLLPRVAGQVAYTLPEPDLIAEGIAWDAAAGALYVSSVHQHRILRIDAASGRVSELLPASAEPWGLFGLAFDPTRRRLWAGAAAVPQVDGYRLADAGRSAVLRVDVDRGLIEARLAPAGRHVFGDLAVAPDGALWASDSVGGGVWRAPAEGAELALRVAPGPLRSPQGIAFAADGRRAFLADYVSGLYVLDTASGALTRLALPEPALRYGMDGVARVGDHLFVVENGAEPHRLVRFDLDPTQERVSAATVVESGLALVGPTAGVLTPAGYLYIAVAQWESFDDDRRRVGAAPVEIRRVPAQ
jgi:sugar lactone lactonase YvrE